MSLGGESDCCLGGISGSLAGEGMGMGPGMNDRYALHEIGPMKDCTLFYSQLLDITCL